MHFDIAFAKNVIENEACAVKDMTKLLDSSFLSAAEMIFNCTGSVILTGIGKAGIIGQKISATLASTGTPSHFLHPAESIHGDLGRLRKNDIVLVLSYGGETDEIIRLITILKQLEIKIIAITGNDKSRLGVHSDIVLCMGQLEEACPLGVAPSVSTTCMLAIGDALALMVMKARQFGVEDYARFHPGGSLGAKLITVEQSMMFQKGESLPVTKTTDTIKRMLADNSHIKRHGAVMIVDDNGVLVGIITDADIRRLVFKEGAAAFEYEAGDIMTGNGN